MDKIRTSLQCGILLLVVLLAGQCGAANLTKGHFLRLAGKIDSATAQAMAANLTTADWYEADLASLMDAFQATIDARKRFAWGKKIPEDIYRKYVVPLRVGDEPLQPFRRKFLDEIAPRLASLHSLARAALEVNLFLGERVGFKPTDRRSQGPLTTLSCGFGRCGELMILAIDAMRSVGIPARGVWVPYWSAQDNNHAWIEVYTEDGWKYMGAAEPATRLNKAWFDKAVQRAGIVLTTGSNNEATAHDAVKTIAGYRLNVIRNYVTPAKLTVEMPQNWDKGDHVWFAVFNFGALRPLVQLQPENGTARLEIGNGDFVLMGRHRHKWFFQNFTAQLNRETKVRLNASNTAPQDFTLTYPWPPKSHRNEPDLISKNRIEQAHALRKQRDIKRYLASRQVARFIDLAGNYREELRQALEHSPGNEATVLNAVLALPPEQRANAIFILSLLSDKDLREVRPDVLLEWLRRTPGRYAGNKELKEFVLDPQIGYEYTGTGLPGRYVSKPLHFTSLAGLRSAVARYSALVDSSWPQRPLPPVTIDHMLAGGTKVSASNAAIWWTDRLRRSGVPARRQPFGEWLEFYYEGKWLPLFPDKPAKLGDRNAIPEVKAHYEEPATVSLQWRKAASSPKWKSDFLFVPIEKNGMLDYWRDIPQGLKQDGNLTSVTLAPGRYLFTAGRRNGRGDVAVRVRTVNLQQGERRTVTLDLVPPPEPPVDNPGLRLQDLAWKPKEVSGKHLLIILGDNEPSQRVQDQAKGITVEGLHVDFINDFEHLSQSDRRKLGLNNRDATGTPYVFYFDENGRLLFTQSGYDLNLPSRVRNAPLGNDAVLQTAFS